MSKRITILGSTGSIGRQSLEVISACGMEAVALTANSSVKLLEEQARRYRPELAVLMDERAAGDLRVKLADTNVRVLGGMEGILEAASLSSADTVITAVVGMIGLRPTLAAIREGKRIALANKETLVCAGQLVLEEARDYGAQIIPVDSEHSALFQCLEGNRDRGEVKRLILTCSGGPFYGKKPAELKGMTRENALQHPNWSMGAKITVDSATLMNKGLEFIEAMHLYRMPPEKISVLIHRESIIHSLVEYCDHAVLAQLGVPDMRLPIAACLSWPFMLENAGIAPLDLLKCGPLTFEAPDTEAFPCLDLARRALAGGKTTELNAANEVAVERFLKNDIRFLDIPALVHTILETGEGTPPSLAENPGQSRAALEDILSRDARTRKQAAAWRA